MLQKYSTFRAFFIMRKITLFIISMTRNILLYIVVFIVCSGAANAQSLPGDKLIDYLVTSDEGVTKSNRDINASDYSGDTLRMYSNAIWKKCTLQQAAVYTEAYKEQGRWHCYDYAVYAMHVRGLVREGYFLDKQMRIPDSIFTWYYGNTSIRATGYFKNGQKSGTWLSFDDSGVLTDSFNYKKGILYGLNFKNDVSNGRKQIYLMDSMGAGAGYTYNILHNNDTQYLGKYAKGFVQDSLWVMYYESGEIWHTVTFKNGKKKAEACFELTGEKHQGDCIQKMPEYPGGIAALQQYLSKNLHYPEAMRKYRAEGTVLVEFIVKSNGETDDVHILASPYADFSKEVIRVIQAMPKWKPAFCYTKNVEVRYKMPVTFRLQ